MSQLPPPAYQTAPARPAQTLSVTSMVLGIAALVLSGFGLLVSIAAVVFGHIARKREPEARGFWLTGLITGYVGIGLAVVVCLILAAIFVPIILLGGFAATAGVS